MQWLSLPPAVAPVKCSVLPLSNNPDFEPFVKRLGKADSLKTIFFARPSDDHSEKDLVLNTLNVGDNFLIIYPLTVSQLVYIPVLSILSFFLSFGSRGIDGVGHFSQSRQ